MTKNLGPSGLGEMAADSTGFTAPSADRRIQDVVSYLNTNYNAHWSWKIDQLMSEDKKLACVGHISFPDGRILSGLGEVTLSGQEEPFKEAEAAAMKAAARLAGWSDNALHREAQVPVDVIGKSQTKTEIKVPQNSRERAVELKTAYGMTTMAHFLSFVQRSRPDILSFADITDAVIDDVHAHALSSPETFAAFAATA